MLISGRTWSQLFLCALACAAQVRAFQNTGHAADKAASVVAGRVVEAGTNAPLRNAIVELRGPSGDQINAIRTSPDGTFAFSHVPSGRWSVDVITNGYQRLTKSSVQVPSSPGDPAFVLALTKLARN